MLEHLKALPDDPILHLTQLCREDPRKDKIDIGVGVFKNTTGETPVMKAVSAAEQLLHDSQTSKSYVGMSGNLRFNAAMIDLVFSDSVDKSRLCALQAPGGSGALRVAAEMLHKAMPEKTLWVSDPTWGNHIPIFAAAGFTVKTYPYLDQQTKMVDEDKMLMALKKMGPDDIVLLHGCCHNPTGSDISSEGWDEISRLVNQQGFLPFIDLAYQGFGTGLDADLYGVRTLAANVSEMVVTSSCSKNFGLYRDRVGCVLVLAKDEHVANITLGQLKRTARAIYSMPPDHGAAIVGIIMNDSALRQMWENELSEMRQRILNLRVQLSQKMAEVTGTQDWGFIAKHQGMFSLLCLDKTQTDILVNTHSIYIVDGGRINIAGLRNDEQVNRFAHALADVTK